MIVSAHAASSASSAVPKPARSVRRSMPCNRCHGSWSLTYDVTSTPLMTCRSTTPSMSASTSQTPHPGTGQVHVAQGCVRQLDIPKGRPTEIPPLERLCHRISSCISFWTARPVEQLIAPNWAVSSAIGRVSRIAPDVNAHHWSHLWSHLWSHPWQQICFATVGPESKKQVRWCLWPASFLCAPWVSNPEPAD